MDKYFQFTEKTEANETKLDKKLVVKKMGKDDKDTVRKLEVALQLRCLLYYI